MRCEPAPSTLKHLKNSKFGPSATVVGLIALAFASACRADLQTTGSPRIVSAEVQRDRDSDRVHVLQQELTKAEGRAADLARQKAERLAASDADGTAKIEANRLRAVDDVAALKRELALATRSAAPSEARTATQPQQAVRRSPATSPKAPPQSAWWDVYSRPRSPANDGPISQATARESAPQTTSGN
jgi:hypothetical protein